MEKKLLNILNDLYPCIHELLYIPCEHPRFREILYILKNSNLKMENMR